MRNTIRDRFEDPDVFDSRGILKPGAVARVRMSMRDAADDGPLDPGELARRLQMLDSERRRSGRPFVVDGQGDSLFGLRRPGPRYLAGGSAQEQRQREQLRDARRQAYLNYSRDQENSWRVPLPSASPTTGAHTYSSEPKSGTPCTLDGAPGRWELDEETEEMTCRVDRRQSGDSSNKTLAQLQLDHRAVMSEVYSAYAKEISEAWRK